MKVWGNNPPPVKRKDIPESVRKSCKMVVERVSFNVVTSEFTDVRSR